MGSPILQVQRLGQSIWHDDISRGLLTSGEFQRLVQMGITGVTSNPTIFQKAIAGSSDYDQDLQRLADSPLDTQGLYEALAIPDIQAAADVLRPVYERTRGADGFASLEVSPALAHDTEATVEEAQRLFAALNRPNVMVKVPATPAGIPAIRRLIAKGVNINVTLIFSLEVYQRVREAYIAGLEDLARAGGDVSTIASVASFFVSRVDTMVDAMLEELIRQGRPELKELQGKAAIANAKLAYRAFQETFGGERFAQLKAKGARVQRPLWASTSTKNPSYSDVMYVENLIGPDTVNTLPPATIRAFQEHGRAALTLQQGVDEAQAVMDALAQAGIDMKVVTARLLDQGVKAFADSFDKLLADIVQKREKFRWGKRTFQGTTMALPQADVESSLEEVKRRDTVARIWRRDHTLWKPDPTEIADRLGWLDSPLQFQKELPGLEAFAREVRQQGVKDVVLLGMGGSCLAPEVLRQTFGDQPGHPRLHLLDSTVPAWVKAVTDAIDPATTLFLVSSKSGGTIETISFYKHFRALLDQRLGREAAGGHFVAITDPGTSLEHRARDEGFRHTFLNPESIGGRFSVLSYFGLVPSALAGLDIGRLLERAAAMRERCQPTVSLAENPGAWLGAVIGAQAVRGRDKLTLYTSPAISSFGLWVEQLIAESTGKEGKGIIPVAGEPLMRPEAYGGDRLFVYMRLESDDNQEMDAHVQRMASAGHPVVRLDLRDRYDLGGEFFRWEFAIAVAGMVLGINPFDQPNVQEAKDFTVGMLQDYQRQGHLPRAPKTVSVERLLSQARPGDYLFVMAYLRQDPDIDRYLLAIRGAVMERYRIATGSGYGPRYLHSQGQVHKGGPGTGLFLMLTADHAQDVPIPGEPYSFGVLADAQALGDLQALVSRGRRVARVHLGRDPKGGVARLVGRLRG